MIRILLAALLLAGCASKPPSAVRIEYREVKTEVPVSCVPKDYPRSTVYDDVEGAIRAAPTPEERYQSALIGVELQAKRGRQSEVVVDGCRR